MIQIHLTSFDFMTALPQYTVVTEKPAGTQTTVTIINGIQVHVHRDACVPYIAVNVAAQDAAKSSFVF